MKKKKEYVIEPIFEKGGYFQFNVVSKMFLIPVARFLSRSDAKLFCDMKNRGK